MKAFESSSYDGKNGHFQVVVGSRLPGSSLTLLVEGYYFTVKGHSTREFFRARFSSSDIQLYTSSTKLTLNEEVYAQLCRRSWKVTTSLRQQTHIRSSDDLRNKMTECRSYVCIYEPGTVLSVAK